VSISDEELKSLTDAIQKRHGLDFSSYEPLSLKRRIVRALHIFSMQSVHELWMRILREHGFIYSFMDEISVGLTAMFRDPILWRKMRSMIAGGFFPQKELSIWHAGCSTGEEVFTMGIVLRESMLASAYSALATDISNQAIEISKKGHYCTLKMTEYDRNYREYNPSGGVSKYYKLADGSAIMDQSLVHHVRYEHHNLINGKFNRKFDIIFCRNVMIYFDNLAKHKLIERFHGSLNDGGLLIIGFYDAVLPMIDSSRFTVLDIDAKIFQKVPTQVEGIHLTHRVQA
jgi:chemotaxis protein methyltransferase CheR